MKTQKIMAWVKTVLIGLLAIVFLLPLLWMVSSSLKSQPQVFETPFRWVTDQLRFDNYVQVWTSKTLPFWKLFINSLIICVGGALGQLIVSSLAAYAFARIDGKGKNVVFILFMVAMMVPVQVTIIPRYIMFREIGIYNTLFSVILPQFFGVTSIFLLRQFFMSLPVELTEAARVDGAGHLRIWFQITMPLIKAGMATVVTLSFITSWNDYLNPLIFLAKRELYTVSLGVRSYLYDFEEQYHLMMAAAACAILPMLIVFLAAQKQFIESIAVTGVKG